VSEWSEDMNDRAWRTYIEASVRLQTRLDDDLQATSGLTLIDYHVLLLLAEAPGGRLRMGDLARRLVFSPSRLTYQVRSMERRGLLVREPDPDDRRGTRAVLTASGLRTFENAAPQHRRAVRRLWTDDLDDDELACLTRVFGRLGRRLGVPVS
jgi:Transcriptional regulators